MSETIKSSEGILLPTQLELKTMISGLLGFVDYLFKNQKVHPKDILELQIYLDIFSTKTINTELKTSQIEGIVNGLILCVVKLLSRYDKSLSYDRLLLNAQFDARQVTDFWQELRTRNENLHGLNPNENKALVEELTNKVRAKWMAVN